MLTQHHLKSLLDYNPETGEFRSLVSRGLAVKGEVAGSITKNGYVEIGVAGEKYFAHGLAFLWMTGEYVIGVDHKDRCATNNAWSNLRKADQRQNNWNRGAAKNSSTGVKGVSPHGNKFKVQIRAFGKKVYLGLFSTVEEGKKHYDEFAELLQGEFACKNG